MTSAAGRLNQHVIDTRSEVSRLYRLLPDVASWSAEDRRALTQQVRGLERFADDMARLARDLRRQSRDGFRRRCR